MLIPCPALPSSAPSRTNTYSAGEGRDWKSGDLQFLQKRNSLANFFLSWSCKITTLTEPGVICVGRWVRGYWQRGYTQQKGRYHVVWEGHFSRVRDSEAVGLRYETHKWPQDIGSDFQVLTLGCVCLVYQSTGVALETSWHCQRVRLASLHCSRQPREVQAEYGCPGSIYSLRDLGLQWTYPEPQFPHPGSGTKKNTIPTGW